MLDYNVYYGTEPDALRVAQLAWLQADLAAVDRAATPWVLATAHMPMQCSSITYDGEFVGQAQRYARALGASPQAVAAATPYRGCTGTGVDNTEASRKDVEPLFLQYGVDLFMCGHEHKCVCGHAARGFWGGAPLPPCPPQPLTLRAPHTHSSFPPSYESMWPTRELAPTQQDFEAPRAPVYVVEGAGGAPALDLFGAPGPFTRRQDSSWGWGRVTVHNASHLTYERVQNDLCRQQCQGSAACPACGLPAGAVLDSWTIYQPRHGGFL